MTDDPFVILARGPWPGERVLVREAAPFVPRHEELVERAWERAREDARASGRRLFPGPVLGLAAFDVQGADLRLDLHRTDYRAFVGTNLSEGFRATRAPRADALGISVLIQLPGGKVLLHRRGSGCFEWPLAIDTPGGHVEPAHFTASEPAPLAAALDELESELGIRRVEVESSSILALARMKESEKPQAIVAVRVTLSFDAIRGRLEHAPERFETSELLLPFALPDIARLARSEERITPAGRAACLLASELL